jgi:hypothetical protein
VRPTPYVDIQQSIDALNPPGRLNYWRSENLSELPDEAIDTLTHYARNVTSPFSYVTLEPKGGAIARVDADDTALSVRDMAYAYYALAVWEDPSDDDRHIAWVREFAQAMSPYTMPGMFLNFVMDEGEQRIRSTYGQRQYERLVALKDKYDPTNVFRHNQNIPPSGGLRNRSESLQVRGPTSSCVRPSPGPLERHSEPRWTTLRNRPKRLGGVCGITQLTAKRAFWVPFFLRVPSKFTLGALLEALFGRFLTQRCGVV